MMKQTVAKQITLRGVEPELARRIGRVAQDAGTSVNTAVLRILERAVGLDESERRLRLARYTTATASDLRELEEAIAAQRDIDPKLWT